MSASTEQLRAEETNPAGIFLRALDEQSVRIRGPRQVSISALVVGLLGPFAALRSKSVQRGLLAIVILDIPLQLGTHVFYREADAASGALAGLSISATTIALLGLYASWFIRALEGRRQEARCAPQRNWALLCYLGLSALSLVVARDVRLSFFELFFLLQMYLVFLYITHFVRTDEDAQFVIAAVLAGCLIESVLMVALGFANASSGLWGPLHIRVSHELNGEFTRIGGTIGSPNEAGAYLSALLALAVSLLFAEIGRKYKWLAAAVLAFGGAALILTFSRGAWVSLFLAITLFAISLGRRKGISIKALIPVVAISLLLYAPFHESIKARLFSDDNGAAESRVPLMKLAFRMIADNPILGVGSNNFSAAMGDYVTSEFRRGFLYTVHNKYLLVWAEIGPLGLLAYLAFFTGALRKGWACWKGNDPLLSVIALGLTFAIVGNMLHQTVEILQDRAMTQLLWVFAGLLTAMHNTMRTQRFSSDPFSSIT